MRKSCVLLYELYYLSVEGAGGRGGGDRRGGVRHPAQGPCTPLASPLPCAWPFVAGTAEAGNRCDLLSLAHSEPAGRRPAVMAPLQASGLREDEVSSLPHHPGSELRVYIL